jgi:hypothetical protein
VQESDLLHLLGTRLYPNGQRPSFHTSDVRHSRRGVRERMNVPRDCRNLAMLTCTRSYRSQRQRLASLYPVARADTEDRPLRRQGENSVCTQHGCTLTPHALELKFAMGAGARQHAGLLYMYVRLCPRHPGTVSGSSIDIYAHCLSASISHQPCRATRLCCQHVCPAQGHGRHGS